MILPFTIIILYWVTFIEHATRFDERIGSINNSLSGDSGTTNSNSVFVRLLHSLSSEVFVLTSVRRFVCVSVYLSNNKGHKPSPIVIKFLNNVLGTIAERRICKGSFISLTFQNGGRFESLFAVTIKRPKRFSSKLDFLDIFNSLKTFRT